MRKLAPLALLLSAAWSISSGQTEPPAPKSLTEARNLETMKRWSDEVWGEGRLELVSELVAPQYVRHDANGTRVVTPESYAQEIAAFRAIGMVFEMNAASIDGDLLWTRWSAHAQPTGGEEIMLRGLQVYRFADGKLAETWLLTADGEFWPDN